MTYPAGLHVIERPLEGAPAVVLVHGSLDRAESFRRVMRRLPDCATVAYDRRGYQGSRQAGIVGLAGHIADLIAMGAEVRRRHPAGVVAVGHSLGGDVVIGAALAEPSAFAAVGAFEPPMPWLGFRRTAPGEEGTPRPWAALAQDPAEEAERFFSRMVSASAWHRLSDDGRASRRADGPALVADLGGVRGAAPFDVAALSVPAVFGMGGSGSQPHHRRTVSWLGANVPGALPFEIAAALHGAHLSHPDHFAAFVRLVLAQGGITAQ